MDDVVQAMLLDGIRAAGARAGTVGIPEGDEVALVGVDGYEQDDGQYWHRFGLQESLPMSDAIRQGTPIVLSTTAERDARTPCSPAAARWPITRSCVCPCSWAPASSERFPLRIRQGPRSVRRTCHCSVRSASNVRRRSRARAGARAERAIGQTRRGLRSLTSPCSEPRVGANG